MILRCKLCGDLSIVAHDDDKETATAEIIERYAQQVHQCDNSYNRLSPVGVSGKEPKGFYEFVGYWDEDLSLDKIEEISPVVTEKVL